MRVRKNQASLTPMEKQRFVAAVLALKASGRYDQYVMIHMNAMQAAHRGPAFCPWHREFLRRFELDLQGIDSSVTIPYWDWTVDNQPTASLWAADLMGGNGRASDEQVMDGPFAFAAGNFMISMGAPPNYLQRAFGQQASSLPAPGDVTAALALTPYDAPPWDPNVTTGFRNRLEGWVPFASAPNMHNRVHVWVGGSMLPMTSPNDPVFFLNHANVDRLWAQWQTMHPAEPYVPVTGGPAGHNLNDPMQPWVGTTTPASVLDHRALGYCFDSEPDCPGIVKIIKDKDLKREKIEIKEQKFEHKEFKREKLEIKELKFEHKEFKREKIEIKEHPEKALLPDKFVPDKGIAETPGGDPFEFEQRLAGVESVVGQLSHFISPQLRPDLSQGALAGEPGMAGDVMGAQSGVQGKLQKDAKDLEKLREG